MKKGLTEIVLLVDRSGSMATIRADMEGALEDLLRKQEKERGECRVTLYTFNDTLVCQYAATKLTRTMTKVCIEPYGTTALIDALCQSVDEVGARLAAQPEPQRPEHVIFVVITDGQENSSSKHVRRHAFDRLKTQAYVYNWKFVYLGANQDSFAEAGALGFAHNQTSDYTADRKGIVHMSATLCSYMSQVRSGVQTSLTGGA